MPSAITAFAGLATAMLQVDVYVDGSARGNGQPGSRAGYGIYFDAANLQHLNRSERLPGPVQTNNRAELMAIIVACEIAPYDCYLKIHTDSEYALNCVNSWIHIWKANGWKTANGRPVENRDLVERLDSALNSRRPHVSLIKVPAHSGGFNEVADRFAREGCDKH